MTEEHALLDTDLWCTQPTHAHVQLHADVYTCINIYTYAMQIYMNLLTHIYHTYTHEDMHTFI